MKARSQRSRSAAVSRNGVLLQLTVDWVCLLGGWKGLGGVVCCCGHRPVLSKSLGVWIEREGSGVGRTVCFII